MSKVLVTIANVLKVRNMKSMRQPWAAIFFMTYYPPGAVTASRLDIYHSQM